MDTPNVIYYLEKKSRSLCIQPNRSEGAIPLFRAYRFYMHNKMLRPHCKPNILKPVRTGTLLSKGLRTLDQINGYCSCTGRARCTPVINREFLMNSEGKKKFGSWGLCGFSGLALSCRKWKSEGERYMHLRWELRHIRPVAVAAEIAGMGLWCISFNALPPSGDAGYLS